mmetsp:Transcript_28622/g.69779  ORF Transcript_28622/g.69779 Transcript_28622/m.69779 type:complete len:540 (-) Transcript_28622:122-1741(-)
MQNRDFRKLLEQDREDAKPKKKQETEEERKAREERRKQKKLASYKRWQERKAALEAKFAKSSYRDRAKERREDKTGADQDEELKKYASMSVEKTKYLGGDVEHTHLVKGLDFALLQRYKEELQREEEEKIEEAYEEMYEKNKKKKKEKEPEKKDKVHFETVWGRGIYQSVVAAAPRKIEPLQNFVPGRMTYEFDLDLQFGSELPATIIHSKEHAMEIEDTVSGVVPPQVSRRVSRILTFLREGSKTLKKKKSKTGAKGNKNSSNGKSSKPIVASLAGMDEGSEDDIFEDAGTDYVPTTDKSEKNSKGYFAKPLSADLDVTQAPQNIPEEPDETSGSKDVLSRPVEGPSLPERPVEGPSLPSAEGPSLPPKGYSMTGYEDRNDTDEDEDEDNDIRYDTRHIEKPPAKTPSEPVRQSLMAGFANDVPAQKTKKKKGGLQPLAPLDYDDSYGDMEYSFDILGGEGDDDDNGKKGTKRKGDGEGSSGGSRRWGAKQRDEQREKQKLDKEWGQIKELLKDKKTKKPAKKASAKRMKILKGFVSK